MGQPISEHVSSITLKRDLSLNVVSQIKYSDAGFFEPDSSNNQMMKLIMPIKGINANYKLMHYRLNMKQLRYKNFYFMGSQSDDQMIQTLGQN